MMISLKRFEEICSAFKDKRLLVVGDIILDRYIFGVVSRISPEAPVPILKVSREEFRLGGAGNVASNVDNLGAKSLLMGVSGSDEFSRKLSDLSGPGSSIFRSRSMQTLIKTRIIAMRQQLVRIDRETDTALHHSIERKIINGIKEAVVDGIIVSDYAKGLINQRLISVLREKAGREGIPIIVDPKPSNFSLYGGINCITPNRREAEILAGAPITNNREAEGAARHILKQFTADSVLITRGAQGITALERGKRAFHLPAFSYEVFDVTGAGDTVVSVIMLALTCGASLREAAGLANAAASIVVEKIGTSQTNINDLRERLRLILKGKRRSRSNHLS